MIYSLRKRHLWVFSVLAIFLPAAYLIGLSSRPRIPEQKNIPDEIRTTVSTHSVSNRFQQVFP